jgi:glutamate-1-semialdehyde aminotransferase
VADPISGMTPFLPISISSTGRTKVISCGYHGWHDWAQPVSSGVLLQEKENPFPFKYKNFDDLVESLEKEKSEVAALVLETPFPDHLGSDIKELCKSAKKHNILVVFDEVKAGGRLGYSSGYDVSQIIPDIAVYGKALGGGLPLSMLLVKEDRVAVIPDDIHCSATFWGYALALHVASNIIDRINSSEEILNLHERSKRFISSNNDLFEKNDVPVRFTGNPVMPSLKVGDKITDRFYSSCFEEGLYIRPKHCLFLSTTHSEAVLDETTNRLESIVSKFV